MVSDGQLRVGMKFETVASACRKVADTERGIGGRITKKEEKQFFTSTNSYCLTKRFNGTKTRNRVTTDIFSTNGGSIQKVYYDAVIGGRVYLGEVDGKNLKNEDAIMNCKYKRIYNSERTQYAEDKNHNGIIDKGEIFDCLW